MKYYVINNKITIIKSVQRHDSNPGPLVQKFDIETITPRMHASTRGLECPYQFLTGKSAH